MVVATLAVVLLASIGTSNASVVGNTQHPWSGMEKAWPRWDLTRVPETCSNTHTHTQPIHYLAAAGIDFGSSFMKVALVQLGVPLEVDNTPTLNQPLEKEKRKP